MVSTGLLRFLLAFMMLILLFSCRNESEFLSDKVEILYVDGQAQFHIDGNPFEVRGVSGSSHLHEAAKIGINTIRAYDTAGLQDILDSAAHHHIMVIAGIWLPKSQDKWFYSEPREIDSLSQKLATLGRKYAEHPALLSWCLGNELRFQELSDFTFSRGYGQLLDSLKAGDPNHPVGTAFANLPRNTVLNFGLKVPELDYYLINTFSQLANIDELLSKVEPFWSRPFLIGEFGEIGPWEVPATRWGAPYEPKSSEKSTILAQQFERLPIHNKNYLGACVFNWGSRQEQTHTWYNFFDEAGAKNAQYFFLADWLGYPQNISPPIIDTLLIDGLGLAQDFWFNAGEYHQAEVRLASGSEVEGLTIEWSVRAEDWYFLRGETPAPLTQNIEIPIDPQRIAFKCPEKPGAFRLFVRVSDDSLRTYATANLPFYVVR